MAVGTVPSPVQRQYQASQKCTCTPEDATRNGNKTGDREDQEMQLQQGNNGKDREQNIGKDKNPSHQENCTRLCRGSQANLGIEIAASAPSQPSLH